MFSGGMTPPAPIPRFLEVPEVLRALADLTDKGARLSVAFFQGLLAELEYETFARTARFARIEATAVAHQVNKDATVSFLHRLRGEILLKCDPANPAPAEEAFQTALAIAKEQRAQIWGLRTALSLAKLHQSTGRPAEAHAFPAPARSKSFRRSRRYQR